MGLFGGGNSSSKTSSNTTTRTDTDSSVTDIRQADRGINLTKKDRGRQVLNINGIAGEDLSGIVGALSGAQSAAFGAIASAGQATADIARSSTGTQTEVGRILAQVAPWLIALGGVIFIFRGR